MMDSRNPHEVSVGKYEGKNNMGDICMDGRIIFRSAFNELIVGLYIGRN